MEQFGYKNIFHDLNGDKIHRLDSVLTLDANVHIFFDRLEIWFEPAVRILLFSLYRVGIERFRASNMSTGFAQ